MFYKLFLTLFDFNFFFARVAVVMDRFIKDDDEIHIIVLFFAINCKCQGSR